MNIDYIVWSLIGQCHWSVLIYFKGVNVASLRDMFTEKFCTSCTYNIQNLPLTFHSSVKSGCIKRVKKLKFGSRPFQEKIDNFVTRLISINLRNFENRVGEFLTIFSLNNYNIWSICGY